MRLRFTILIFFALATLPAAGQTVMKCDRGVLLKTTKKVGKLDHYEIRDFLLTFGKECRNNVEYSEWSNEILFSLFEKQIELTLRTIEKEEKKIELDVILESLSSPVSDRVNITSLILKVDVSTINSGLKKQIIESLNKARQL